MLNVSSSADPSGPRQPGQLHQLGIAAYKEGRLEEAAGHFRQLARLLPKDAGVWEILGIVLHRGGRLEEAEDAYGKAAGLKADPHVLNNWGAVLLDLGKFEAALVPLAGAVKASPGDARARVNLARALIKLGRTTEAVGHLADGLKMNPGDPELLAARGAALATAGESKEAVVVLRESLAARADSQVHRQLLMAMHEAGEDAGVIYAEAREWNRRHVTPVLAASAGRAWGNDRSLTRRLKVGYLSADFCIHPVATFFEPLLNAHARDRVVPWCYSAGGREDGVTARLRRDAQRGGGWRDVRGLSDAQIAEAIRRDGVDILVELGGHTPTSRLMVLAHRAAPVQVTYLGYPGSTGMDGVDYRMTESFLDGPSVEAWHSEKVVRLGGDGGVFAVYMPPDSRPAVAAPPMLASGVGGVCTFGVSSSRGKISREVVEVWAEILARVPKSRIRMTVTDVENDARAIVPMFERHGVAAGRVELVRRREIQDYMSAHAGVDILLDTFPLSGHTVVCHGMWVGVPAVCLAGRTCWQRLGASVMEHAGLGEFVGKTREEYVEIAVRAAGDVPRLAELRGGMRERMKGSVLMGYETFARGVEEEYRRMWGTWAGGL